MDPFQYRKNRLYCEDVPLADIAGRVGTPFYVYSQTSIEEQFTGFDAAFRSIPHLTCYAVKANSNLALLNIFQRLGAGFDIVSGGELLRVIRAGGDPHKVVFSGVGKTESEIDLGLKKGILQFNVESEAELEILEARARALGRRARISLRVNPDVDPGTHPYISTGLLRHKFGIPMEQAARMYRKALRSRHLEISGAGFHIGSQITTVQPFVDALSRVKELVLRLRREGIRIRHLDLGGGLGIVYDRETPPEPAEYSRVLLSALGDFECTLLLEPGRIIVGNAGALTTRVLLTKTNGEKNFVVVDAGMTDLLRPSLYGSYHALKPERLRGKARRVADVVGPICETGDFLARDREMQPAKARDLLAVMSAGAYGFVLSSNYNSRPRPPEVLVRGSRFKVVRKRESSREVMRGESPVPFAPAKSKSLPPRAQRLRRTRRKTEIPL